MLSKPLRIWKQNTNIYMSKLRLHSARWNKNCSTKFDKQTNIYWSAPNFTNNHNLLTTQNMTKLKFTTTHQDWQTKWNWLLGTKSSCKPNLTTNLYFTEWHQTWQPNYNITTAAKPSVYRFPNWDQNPMVQLFSFCEHFESLGLIAEHRIISSRWPEMTASTSSWRWLVRTVTRFTSEWNKPLRWGNWRKATARGWVSMRLLWSTSEIKLLFELVEKYILLSGGSSCHQPALPVWRPQDQRRWDSQGPGDGTGQKMEILIILTPNLATGRCHRSLPGADWRWSGLGSPLHGDFVINVLSD